MCGLRSFRESSKVLDPHSSTSALPPHCFTVRCTSIHFAKNQLCLSLIGLSPLASSHPRLLLQTSVRPSKRHYASFNLLKARSLSFGSNESNKRVHWVLAFASLPHKYLSVLISFSRWPIMQKVHRHLVNRPSKKGATAGSDCLWVFWFRSFHSRWEGSFHLSFTVLVRYRSPKRIYGLEGGSPAFKQWTFYLCIHGMVFIRGSYRVLRNIPKAFTVRMYGAKAAFFRQYSRHLGWFFFL